MADAFQEIVRRKVETKAQQGARRYGDIAIFIAFATLDAEEHAGAIDLGNLELHAFQEAQAAGVDDAQAHAIGWTTNLREHACDLVRGEDDREMPRRG